jgi:PAS domain S-box-containing protein
MANTKRVRDTEILASDSASEYRQKLARIALDEMYQFVAVLDPQGTLLEVNRAALEGGGLKRTDVEGLPFWKCFWWGVSEKTQDDLKAAIGRAAQGEFIRYDVEVYGRAGGKETIVIDFSMIPVKDALGEVVFIVPEGRDITEKKVYEREIAQKNADLQTLLARIRELDEIKTQFFANVSHELRTPLALILGPAERILQSKETVPLHELTASARVIARNARMLLKHVNDLLDISKLDAGKLKIELCRTDLSALLRLICSHFDVLAAERRIDFLVETPPAFLAMADPDKLQRVVMNLVSNAFKFTPAGGKVACRLRPTETSFRLSVEDSGPGVRPELRRTIFERFRQGDGGADRQFGGTGLGLAIAHEFVALHKGVIEVRDSDLGGAFFEVTVPLHPERETNTSAAPAMPAVDRGALDGLVEELRLPATVPQEPFTMAIDGKPLVLVVEDNREMSQFIVQSLASEYRVVPAFDGREGLAQARSLNPALIVSDIMMPVMSGPEMIAALRQEPEFKETPILVLSAKADDDLKSRLLETGAEDFITKPFAERDLLVRVRNLVRIAQSRDAFRRTESEKRISIEATNRELQIRTQNLSELFEKTPSFMAVLRGPEHIFELANSAYYRLVGDRKVIGMSVIEAFPEIKGQGFIELLDGVLATGQPFVGQSQPILLQRQAGAPLEKRFIDYIYQPLTGSDRAITGVFVEGHDVTDQKRAEDALLLANRRKDEFLATLAHELRNPLGPIRHAAMITQGSNTTEAELKWSHEVIDRQVAHMGRLLDDLLEISRVSQGKLELRKERLSVNEWLMRAVETIRPLVEKRGHTLNTELLPVSADVEADPVRFEQIFSNLLNNAAKYTNTGGTIRIRARQEGGAVLISIKDNGIGIHAELLPQIFEMFSQASSALDRSEGGLGIGLALVRGLVLLHGGEIEARSAGLGCGSEFIVTLPVAQPKQASPAESPAPLNSRSPAKKWRILVADDSRDSANTCAILLLRLGHEVRTAYTGREAVVAAAEFNPEFALLDIGMPEMNGFEVAREIRKNPRNAGMILVALSGWGQEGDKRNSTEAGFNAHLVKPLDFNVLKKLLNQCDKRN